MEEEQEETKKSKYNSAIAKEIRRAELWKDVNKHSREGLYIKWNEDLDCIWSELCVDIKEKKTAKQKEDFESYKKKFDEFDRDIIRVGVLKDSYNEGFSMIPADFYKKRNEQYKKLREKEIFLRRLENELGKGTQYSDEDEEGM